MAKKNRETKHPHQNKYRSQIGRTIDKPHRPEQEQVQFRQAEEDDRALPEHDVYQRERWASAQRPQSPLAYAVIHDSAKNEALVYSRMSLATLQDRLEQARVDVDGSFPGNGRPSTLVRGVPSETLATITGISPQQMISRAFSGSAAGDVSKLALNIRVIDYLLHEAGASEGSYVPPTATMIISDNASYGTAGSHAVVVAGRGDLSSLIAAKAIAHGRIIPGRARTVSYAIFSTQHSAEELAAIVAVPREQLHVQPFSAADDLLKGSYGYFGTDNPRQEVQDTILTFSPREERQAPSHHHSSPRARMDRGYSGGRNSGRGGFTLDF
ncbi:MAG TPA: hypothetical protein VJI15_00500 [Candidatus Nanoarchaeia archaeon]|nr:hypothetical protein [Candidatus Nanoarchaeia archaeon]